jgi:hypothetical protein
MNPCNYYIKAPICCNEEMVQIPTLDNVFFGVDKYCYVCSKCGGETKDSYNKKMFNLVLN